MNNGHPEAMFISSKAVTDMLLSSLVDHCEGGHVFLITTKKMHEVKSFAHSIAIKIDSGITMVTCVERGEVERHCYTIHSFTMGNGRIRPNFHSRTPLYVAFSRSWILSS